ncbi:replicative DNA helicase [Candidatus Phytoplasma phoenicium]|uniref:Replicative DNA helicase n=1 Tax=Candidatus Phytoplasma phoenicium TaxID=198422 RepID=A0A0L0MJT0_9MOLU|nr:replicative DNA helicase [Candidatus Phytoplasma phoenicium]KND62598.1 Replicative DNA helicase [Candidatus Phytoplasma phoenicium]
MKEHIKLPYYLEAEQSILGIILLDPKRIIDIENRLQVFDFFNPFHQYIFAAMKELFNKGQDIDYYSVFVLLRQKGQLNERAEEYLVKLGNFIPSFYHLDTYMELVLDASLKRNVIETALKIYHEGVNNTELDSQSFLNFVEEQMFHISQKKRVNHFVELKNLLKKVKTKTLIRREHNIIGLSTGYSNLDDITLGLKPEELIILAARPSMGKSSFMINLAVQIAKSEEKPSIALFSLEMSNEQLVSRMLSSNAWIAHKKIQLGILNEKELHALDIEIHNLQNLNIYFDDSATVNILDIRAQCRQLKTQKKLDLVIIDYLQLIHKNNKNNYQGFSNRQEEVSDISKSLKQMARELQVPVIALSQLSREVEKREDKRPILSDLRDSGSIEQDADIVMFLYRKKYYIKNKDKEDFVSENNSEDETELIIAKNRQGMTGTKKFIFDSEHLFFVETDDIKIK